MGRSALPLAVLAGLVLGLAGCLSSGKDGPDTGSAFVGAPEYWTGDGFFWASNNDPSSPYAVDRATHVFPYESSSGDDLRSGMLFGVTNHAEARRCGIAMRYVLYDFYGNPQTGTREAPVIGSQDAVGGADRSDCLSPGEVGHLFVVVGVGYSEVMTFEMTALPRWVTGPATELRVLPSSVTITDLPGEGIRVTGEVVNAGLAPGYLRAVHLFQIDDGSEEFVGYGAATKRGAPVELAPLERWAFEIGDTWGSAAGDVRSVFHVEVAPEGG